MKNVVIFICILFLSSASFSLPLGICLPKVHCSKVDYIQNINGRFACYSFAQHNFKFDCTKLFKLYGRRILHQPVMLSTETVDTCHVPGICGQRACVPNGIPIAEFNSMCMYK